MHNGERAQRIENAIFSRRNLKKREFATFKKAFAENWERNGGNERISKENKEKYVVFKGNISEMREIETESMQNIAKYGKTQTKVKEMREILNVSQKEIDKLHNIWRK